MEQVIVKEGANRGFDEVCQIGIFVVGRNEFGQFAHGKCRPVLPLR